MNTRVEITQDTVQSNRANQRTIDNLNTHLQYDADGNILPQETMDAAGVSYIGVGILDNDGRSYIREESGETTCWLCVTADGKYVNLWVAAESGENGFDDQTELHFVEA
jgi:hypothetical protein